jgi:hypothetical protein
MFDIRWFINSVNGMKKMKVTFVFSLFVLLSLLMICGCINPDSSTKPAENQSSVVIDTNITFPATPATIPPPTAMIIPDLNKTIDVSDPGPFLARGDELTIKGKTLPGGDLPVRTWLIEDNYVNIINTTPSPDGSFESNINNILTYDMPNGLLFLIIQCPGPNNRFDINYNPKSGTVDENDPHGLHGYTSLFNLKDIDAKDSSVAGYLLVNALENQNGPADDLYRYFIINVEDGFITIDQIPNQTRRDLVSIKGTTNLRTSDKILVLVVQQEGLKYVSLQMVGNWSVITGISEVRKGSDSKNTWEFLFNASGWPPDTYYLSADGISVDTRTETTFKLE